MPANLLKVGNDIKYLLMTIHYLMVGSVEIDSVVHEENEVSIVQKRFSRILARSTRHSKPANVGEYIEHCTALQKGGLQGSTKSNHGETRH